MPALRRSWILPIALALSFVAGAFLRNPLAADTTKLGSVSPSTVHGPTEVSLLEARVAQLEKKMATLEQQAAAAHAQYLTHTHKCGQAGSPTTPPSI